MQTEHFSRSELECRCGCGRAEMDPAFMANLEALRLAFGGPLFLSSAYRCPDYNAKISHTGRHGPHTTGKAVDILIYGDEAYRLTLLAMNIGFSGLGVNQRGVHAGRFIHLDNLSFPDYPRPRIWSY